MSNKLTSEQINALRKNQRLLVIELLKRNIKVNIISQEMELIEAQYKNHHELILDRACSPLLYASAIICSEKNLCKTLVSRAGLNTPKGNQFTFKQISEALDYSRSLNFPLVIKPSVGSGGFGCQTNIKDIDHLKDAIERIISLIGSDKAFLIEEEFTGAEYRIFITQRGDYAVLLRDPASVTGDGKHNIEELAAIESDRRMNPHTTCLRPLAIDVIVKEYLDRKDLSLSSVPNQGQKIYLRGNSNIGVGGFCEDFTDKAHPSVIELARKALNSINGLTYAGVDIMCSDITKQQTDTSYSILEVNSNPGLNMHISPGTGKSRDVVSMLVDCIFPETV